MYSIVQLTTFLYTTKHKHKFINIIKHKHKTDVVTFVGPGAELHETTIVIYYIVVYYYSIHL